LLQHLFHVRSPAAIGIDVGTKVIGSQLTTERSYITTVNDPCALCPREGIIQLQETTMNTRQKATIKKIARVRDKATENYLEVIEFPISETDINRLKVPPSVVCDLKAFEKRLRDAGAMLPKDDEKRNNLLTSVAKSDPPEEWLYEARTGWTESRRAFVLVNGMIGDAKAKIVGVNRANSIKESSGRLSNRGRWKSWRDTVAERARLSTVLMFSICVALAAPLLGITNRSSFAICLFGRSRVGKSIATLLGASVIGIPRIADMITWNITDSRFEERISEFMDTLFPIEDFSNMNGNKKRKYQRICDIAYRISQGVSTARHSSYTAAHGGIHDIWRSIILTSSERPIRDLAQAAKLERQHGEAIRLIDVPAVFDDLDHIFDRLPKEFCADNCQNWKKDTFMHFATACTKDHGKAFRKYIKFIIGERAALKEYVRKAIAYFVHQACDEHDGDVARDVAEKFGLIYAGGRLGIRCGLLPWGKPELLDAITKYYISARELLPDDGVATRQGITALKAKLHELPHLSKKRARKTDFEKIEGYRKRREKENRYFIKRDAFNSIFGSETQRALVTEWLIQRQHITLAISKESAGTPSPAPKEQFKWPDGKRHRSIEIALPRRQNKKRKQTGAAQKAE
jgi:uncharacterized protein (DUF927 family)